jgi:uncharacterized repeat protein (TIGR01451 family)
LAFLRKLASLDFLLEKRRRLSRFLVPQLEVLEDRTLHSTANLQIVQSAAASVQAGGNLVYAITLTNAGPNAAQNVTLNDTLPGGTTYYPGMKDSRAVRPRSRETLMSVVRLFHAGVIRLAKPGLRTQLDPVRQRVPVHGLVDSLHPVCYNDITLVAGCEPLPRRPRDLGAAADHSSLRHPNRTQGPRGPGNPCQERRRKKDCYRSGSAPCREKHLPRLRRNEDLGFDWVLLRAVPQGLTAPERASPTGRSSLKDAGHFRVRSPNP